jgi:hypothetical protein
MICCFQPIENDPYYPGIIPGASFYLLLEGYLAGLPTNSADKSSAGLLPDSGQSGHDERQRHHAWHRDVAAGPSAWSGTFK